MDNEFEPHDEREITDNLDQKDFEPYDPDEKYSQEEEQKIEKDTPNTQANETTDCIDNFPGRAPYDNHPKGKGDTVIIIPQQSENKNPPKSQPKPTKSDGKFWEKLDQGIKEFIKTFKEFFVKSDEEINRELKKKEYKKSLYEK